MKRLELVQSGTSASMIGESAFQEPLTETDILVLQDKFLTNGFQYLQLQNVDSGRTLIETFLESMHMYHTLACLTSSSKQLPSNVSDIYYDLAISKSIKENLVQYFVDQFYYDFMWIEATNDLIQADWYKDFESFIIDFKIDQQIPIIFISYLE